MQINHYMLKKGKEIAVQIRNTPFTPHLSVPLLNQNYHPSAIHSPHKPALILTNHYVTLNSDHSYNIPMHPDMQI